MSNKRILKAYERYDYNGRVVPGSLVLRNKIPKNGKWKELQTYECCNLPLVNFDVTADWTLTTPEVTDEASFISFITGGEDGDGNTNNISGVTVSDFSLVDGRLRCNLSSTDTNAQLGLAEIDATSMISIGNIPYIFLSLKGNTTLSLTNSFFNNYSSLQTLNISNLITPVNLSSLSNLEYLYAAGYSYPSLNISSLSSLIVFVGGGTNFQVETLNFANLENLNSIELNSPPNLIQINISGCTSLQYVNCYNSPLADVIINNCPNIIQLQLNQNQLDGSTLDEILITLDNNGLTGGLCLMTSNPGYPAASGLAAAANLTSKGWTINI